MAGAGSLDRQFFHRKSPVANQKCRLSDFIFEHFTGKFHFQGEFADIIDH